jgi:uroporphyrinogen-III synthase
MPDTVVITRPLAQARGFAQRVTAAGMEPAVFPLLEIHPLADQSALRSALADLSRYALVAFVSPNAIDIACGLRAAWPSDLLLAVMGEGSRAALARHGVTEANARIVSPRHPERSDSETLVQELDLDALRGSRALIVRGTTGREWLAEALRAAGIAVEQVAAYERRAPVLDQARRGELSRLLAGDAAWVITSSEGLRNLLTLTHALGGDALVAKLQQKRVFVPHARIVETAQSLGFRRVTGTGSGDEALLAALQSRG